MNKIYCFGDGFAHGHIWPEWPQILQALFPQYDIVIKSGIGAGPEFLVNLFVDLLPIDGMVIFQWPDSDRFDKIIEDVSWEKLIAQDPVYNFNTYIQGSHKWWLSSASELSDVKLYHDHFVQSSQSARRLEVYQRLVKEILEKSNCQYLFTSNWEQMRHADLRPEIRGTEIQPSPLSHFYFLTKSLLPKLGLKSQYELQLEQLLTDQQWIAYDPDRRQIWSNIKIKLYSTKNK